MKVPDSPMTLHSLFSLLDFVVRLVAMTHISHHCS